MPATAATPRAQAAALRDAHLYTVSIVTKTPTHVTARVSRKGDLSRSYTVWLDTAGAIACQCERSRHNPGAVCRHMGYVLAALGAGRQ